MAPESADRLIAFFASGWFPLIGIGFAIFVLWSLGGLGQQNRSGDSGGSDGGAGGLFDGDGDGGDGGGDGGGD